MRWLTGGALALTLGLGSVACGGEPDAARRALAQASDQLAQLRSGRLAVSGHIDPVGSARDIDVHAEGSFATPASDAAPVAELVSEGTRRVVRAKAPLRAIRLEDWVARPEVEPGAPIDGTATRHVHGRLRAQAALDDLRALGLTAPFPADQVRSGSVDLWVGQRDHILRRGVLTTAVGLQLPHAIAAALDRTVGATVRLELELTHSSVWPEERPSTVLP